MDIPKILSELRAELAQLDAAIGGLARLALSRHKRRGRPPKWLLEAVPKRRGRPPKATVVALPVKVRKPRTKAQRDAQAERMRKYWAERKKREGKQAR